MIITISLSLQLEPGEELPPETEAVRRMQDAMTANTTPEVLAGIWQEAAKAFQAEARRQRHPHKRKVDA